MYSVDPESLKEETRLYLTQNPDKLIQAVETGVMVLSHVNTSQEVEFVNHAFDKLNQQFQKQILLMEGNINKIVIDTVGHNFDPNSDGSYSAKMVNFLRDSVRGFKDETEKKLAEVKTAYDEFVKAVDFEKETSPLGKVKSIIVETQKFIDAQFDDEQPNSFAKNLKEKLTVYFSDNGVVSQVLQSSIRTEMDKQIKPIMEEFIKVRELLAQKKGEEDMLDKASQKGFVFEDELFVVLQDTAKRFGDAVDESGLVKESSTGSQKGDFLYHLDKSKTTIVIEAKDKKIKLKESLEYMKEALASRNSPIGILVTKNADQLQEQIGTFGFYNANTIITHAAFITEAIRFAKLYIQMQASKESDAIDTAKIQNQIQILLEQFKVDTTIKTKLTQIDKTVNETTAWIRTEIDKATTERKNAINAILEEVEK